MRRLPLFALSFASVLALGCGAGSPLIDTPARSADGGTTIPVPDPGAGPFAGTWRGEARTTITASADGGGSSSGNVATIVVEISDAGTSMRVAFGPPDTLARCIFAVERRGSTATIPNGTSCEVSDGGTRQTITFSAGTLAVSGAMLQFNFTGSAAITGLPGSSGGVVTFDMTGIRSS